jgi:hypothetical protein
MTGFPSRPNIGPTASWTLGPASWRRGSFLFSFTGSCQVITSTGSRELNFITLYFHPVDGDDMILYS